MTVLEHITLPEVRAALEAHPGLTRAVSEIARRSGVREEVINEHIGAAVLEALGRLGDAYVGEMGEAIVRVDRARTIVRDFYEGVLSGQDTHPDTAALGHEIEALHDAVTDITDPQRWAQRKAAAGDNPAQLPASPSGTTGTAGTTEVVPTAASRAGWRRAMALPEGLYRALSDARTAHPDLVEAALGGDTSAASALANRLAAEGVPQARIDDVLGGLAAIHDPNSAYALGGELTPTGQTMPLLAPRRPAALEALRNLPGDQQTAVRRAMAADPDFVRDVVATGIPSGPFRGRQVPWNPAEFDAFCTRHGFTGPERASLEAGLRGLNRANSRDVAGWIRGTTDLSPDDLSAAAREHDALLHDPAAALRLPEASIVRDALAQAPVLREMAAVAPDHFMSIVDLWVRRTIELRELHQEPPSLRDYYMALMRTQVRGGIFGEFGALFRLGEDFWVLKTPDLNPTAAGTDFVVVSQINGESWYCDNKTLSENSLSRVSSLVENFPRNLQDDINEFGPGIDAVRDTAPPAIVAALDNARAAAAEIRTLVGNMTGEQIAMPEIQAEITRICFLHAIRRVVTNAGGELSRLTSALARLGIDLANLESYPMDRPGYEDVP